MASIAIMGFMATGKSTVGAKLARRLGRRFVDTDALVEKRARKSVAQIFATDGEARFREMERDAVAEACGIPNAVISIGGGALVDPASRDRLLAVGPLVCLEASPEEILRRVGDAASRPLLAGATDRLARIRELLAARESAYRLASHRIDTTGLTADEAAERVSTAVGAV